MRPILIAASAVLALVIAGCSSTSKPKGPTLAKGSTLAQIYTLEHWNGTMKNLSGVPMSMDRIDEVKHEMTLEGETVVGEGVLETAARWCVWQTVVPGLQERLNRAFAKVCDRRGGVANGNVCSAPDNRDNVIFLFKTSVSTVDRVSCAVQVEAYAVEATGEFTSKAYWAKLRDAGFETQGMQELKQFVAQQQREEKIAAAHAQRRANFLGLKERGRMVCQQFSHFTRTGYVEDFTDQRVKISVVSAHATNLPSMGMPGFQPTTLWAMETDGWYACRTK